MNLKKLRQLCISNFFTSLILVAPIAQAQEEIDTGLLTGLQSLMGSKAGGPVLQTLCTEPGLIPTCYGFIWGIMFAYDRPTIFSLHSRRHRLSAIVIHCPKLMNRDPSLTKNMSPPMIIIAALREAYPQIPTKIPRMSEGKVQEEIRATVCQGGDKYGVFKLTISIVCCTPSYLRLLHARRLAVGISRELA